MCVNVLLRNGQKPFKTPLASEVVYQLQQLHVAVPTTRDLINGLFRCAYDGQTWPCRERLILDGYEPRL